MLKTIIIVDDDAEDIDLMKDAIGMLEERHVCVSFFDACEALEYLRSDTLVPTLIVVDLHMPKISGQECLDEIRLIQRLRDTPVAIYSSAAPPTTLIKAIQSAGSFFFQKPSSYEVLVRTFQHLTSGRGLT
jgi:CheY-like chemotaxis protein